MPPPDRAVVPPKQSPFSATSTSSPSQAATTAVVRPAPPEPTTITSRISTVFTSVIGIVEGAIQARFKALYESPRRAAGGGVGMDGNEAAGFAPSRGAQREAILMPEA